MIYILIASIILLWVLPIILGIRAARRKNRSPHWLWFGLYPAGALIVWLVIELSTELKECSNCKEKTSASSKFCPNCSQPFEIAVSVSPGCRNWAQKHKGWAIALTVIIGFASFAVLLFGMISISFRNSWVYQDALKRAQSDAEVIEVLGAPIKDGWFISGSLELRGNGEGDARLSIPIYGPQMKGSLHASAERHNGIWSYRTLTVVASDGQQIINLLSKR